jgi:hypothetical protein
MQGTTPDFMQVVRHFRIVHQNLQLPTNGLYRSYYIEAFETDIFKFQQDLSCALVVYSITKELRY